MLVEVGARTSTQLPPGPVNDAALEEKMNTATTRSPACISPGRVPASDCAEAFCATVAVRGVILPVPPPPAAGGAMIAGPRTFDPKALWERET